MGTLIVLLVCAGLIALAVKFISRKNRANVYRNQSYKVRPVPVPYSPTATQTRKEAVKTTTLNSYPEPTSAKRQDDNDDGIATVLAAAVFLDSPLASPSVPDTTERDPGHHDFQGGGGEFGGAGASGSWDSDCSTDHSSDSGSSCDTGSSSYDSGGGFDSGGGGDSGSGGGSD